jgi:hypothetical protein
MINYDQNAVRYCVDGSDRICSVDNNWQAFAEANGAPELAAEFVVGRPLWDFFRGKETIALSQMIFGKLRVTGASFVIPFRCDSPDFCRPMVMLVQPGDEKTIEISTRTAADFQAADLKPLTHRVGELVKVCAWCCRVELLSKTWVEIEHAIGDMGVLSETSVPPISHGICPECFELVRAL